MIALLTVLAACDKDETPTPSNNSAPPPPPPPPDSTARCDNSQRARVNAQLIPIARLPEKRLGFAVAAVGGKILFAGGFNEDGNLGFTRVDIYDVGRNTWSTAELSAGRGGMAAVTAGNKVFFAGGFVYNWDTYYYKTFDTVDIYDAENNTWAVARLSGPRGSLAAATVGNKVLFAGGSIELDNITSATVDIYDLSTDSWSTALLSEAKSDLIAVTLNNKIYFAGGHKPYGSSAFEATNRIEIYDHTTNSWSTDTLKRPMGYLAGIAAADQIYWAENCSVEIKNVQAGTSSEAFLYRSVQGGELVGLKALMKNNKIIFFRPHPDGATNTFDIYDLATQTWSIGTLPMKVYGAYIFSVDDTIYLAGGMIYNTYPTDQVWKLEF